MVVPVDMYIKQYAAEILKFATDAELLKLAIAGMWCSVLVQGCLGAALPCSYQEFSHICLIMLVYL